MTVQIQIQTKIVKKAGLPPDACIQLSSHANNMVKLLFNFSDLLHRYKSRGNPGVQKWDRELLRLEGASVGCAGCINSQPTRPSEETLIKPRSCVEILPSSSHVKEPSVTAHRRPVALANISVPTHHLSLFRVLWRLNFIYPLAYPSPFFNLHIDLL